MARAFLICAFAAILSAGARADEGTVKVFILAGQSNMEGKAKNALLDRQAADPRTSAFYAHLRDGGKWVVRDDVFIKFLERHGALTAGFGSPGCTGVEYEFGAVMGQRLAEPVLLIKAAWGGHSLVKDFRPPSAGLPDEPALAKELAQAQENVRKSNEKNKKNDPLPTMADIKQGYGRSYQRMLEEVKASIAGMGELFPELKGKKAELRGLVWFQGWNDQYGGQDEYQANLEHFIKDVRKDLGAPNLPVVVAAMGQNGSKLATGAMLTVQRGQLAMNDVAEFKGNVKAIRTDELVDKEAEALFPTWRQNVDKWNQVGSDFGYHYYGSGIWYGRIGKAMADAMLELMRIRVAPRA